MNYLLAVSGGVDSVVLLDMMASGNNRGDNRLVVAHVDHGIRSDSQADARFVEALAKRYGLPYVACRLELGSGASEDVARQARYKFLTEQADKFQATIVTAHHEDDLVGSIAINLIRGTGWRGLNVMSRPGISRPLLAWDKQRIYRYALEQKLEWVEDSTNASASYLRNRLRSQVVSLSEPTRQKLKKLWYSQKQLTHEIDTISRSIIERAGGSRHFYTMIDDRVAIELLRTELAGHSTTRPTASTTARALSAIKTARAGSKHDVSGSLKLSFDKRNFIVDVYPEMIE